MARAGFPTCIPNVEALRETFGVRLKQLELNTLFERARAVEPSAVEAVASRLPAGVETLDPAAVRATLSAYVALRDLSAREGLDALALRCWPQFFSDLGGAACGALSLLGDEHSARARWTSTGW